MRVRIRMQKMEITGSLNDLIQRRIGFALGRVARTIDEVSVVLDAASEPAFRGGVQCGVQVRLAGGQTVKVVEVDREIGIAIDVALERAARGVQRKLELERRGFVSDDEEEPL